MSLVENILKELSNTTLRYKGMRVNLLGLPQSGQSTHGSIRSTLSRLNKNNLIEKTAEGWAITELGKKYLKRKFHLKQNFSSPFSKNASKNLMVMFDIPEERKSEREWFRWHLRNFGYVMIQKSVWVGPSPLPKDFMSYLKDIKLMDTIKTFKLARPYKK